MSVVALVVGLFTLDHLLLDAMLAADLRAALQLPAAHSCAALVVAALCYRIDYDRVWHSRRQHAALAALSAAITLLNSLALRNGVDADLAIVVRSYTPSLVAIGGGSSIAPRLAPRTLLGITLSSTALAALLWRHSGLDARSSFPLAGLAPLGLSMLLVVSQGRRQAALFGAASAGEMLLVGSGCTLLASVCVAPPYVPRTPLLWSMALHTAVHTGGLLAVYELAARRGPLVTSLTVALRKAVSLIAAQLLLPDRPSWDALQWLCAAIVLASSLFYIGTLPAAKSKPQ